MARLGGEAKEEDSTFGPARLARVGSANDAPLHTVAADLGEAAMRREPILTKAPRDPHQK